jgi:hypothetical protein
MKSPWLSVGYLLANPFHPSSFILPGVVMSFWQRLFGGRPAPAAVDFELAGGELSVHVARADLPSETGPVPCWAYVTRGMPSAGQKEMVFCLRVADRETAAPQDLLPVFERLFGLARDGVTADEGGLTTFWADNGFLGLTGRTGFAYIRATKLPGVAVPDGAITAVLLTDDEAELAEIIGPYRVTALLGRRARVFPCPQWSERTRPSVLTRDDMDRSVLRKTPLAAYPGASVRLTLPKPPDGFQAAAGVASPLGGRVTLRLPLPQPPGFRDAIASMPAEWSLALLCRPDPEAAGWLVWSPGQDTPETITSGSPAHVTGGFALLGVGAQMKDGGGLLEDGFSLTFTPASAGPLRKALMDAGPLTFPGEGGRFGIAIEWLPPPVGDEPAFVVHRTAFYQGDDVLRQRVPRPDELSAYLRNVMQASANYWAGVDRGPGRAVLLTAALRPGRARFWIDANPPVEPILLGPWLERLEAIPVPEVAGPVAVAMEAALWREPMTPWHWPSIPGEWQAACASRALQVPDGVLDVVWPE